jgi:hypothetical protein
MRWRAPPPSFPGARRPFSAFDVAASLFVVAVAVHAGFLMLRGVPAGYERLAVVWLCAQVGALGLVLYFWADRSGSSREAMRFAAVCDLLLLAGGLVFPNLVPWAARVLHTPPSAYL